MNHSLRTYLLVVLCAVLAACAKDNDVLAGIDGEGMALAFMPDMDDENATRAIELQDVYTTFGVWTHKMVDGARQSVMDGYEVNYTVKEHWQYKDVLGQSLKYWDPNASSYSFVGVAPYTESTKSKFGIDGNGHVKLTNGTDAIEWLAARMIRTKSTLNDFDDIAKRNMVPQPEAFSDIVPLVFHHLMAQVEIRIYSDGDPLDIDPLKIDFKNFYRQGNYAEGTGWTGTGTKTASLTVVNKAVTVSQTTQADAQSLHIRTVMPQGLDGVEIQVSIDGGPLSSLLLTGSWEQEKKYIYYLRVRGGEQEIILVDVTVEPWAKGEDIDAGKVTNW